MHGTRLPLRTWFWAAYLVSTFSSWDLGQAAAAPARAMLHKLRGAMVAPERELLKDEVEIDEFWLGGYEEGLKGSPQRGKRALVGIVIEVRGRGSGRLRLQVLTDPSRLSLLAMTKATTAPDAIVHTDGWQGHNVLAKHGYDHRRHPKQTTAPGERLLPRAHRATSNLKAWMHGTHRGVSKEHLPAYLDEFVFRHNRRHTPMAGFQTLLSLGLAHEPITYREIINQAR
jgi:transposase-like protein